MIEKIMKAVKSGNKKRGKNITIGAVVGMLLSCTAVLGGDVSGLEITQDTGGIKFSKDYTENIWDEESTIYTNNTTISGTTADGEGSGINVNVVGVNIINKGTISGTSGGNSKSGYGIMILSPSIVKDITNTGLIIGVGSEPYGSSYGISNEGTITGTIKNNGLITGPKSGHAGYGIANNRGSIERLVNNGLITGDGSNAGATGIYNVNGGNIGELINTGLITPEKRGNGIYNSSNTSNKGITTLKNSGVIHGTNSGIVNSDEGVITNLVNNGVISGETNAINDETSNSIKNMLNTGAIYGKANAIKSTGTVNEANNYGLLISGDSAGGVVNSNLSIVAYDDAGGNNKIKNHGLAFTPDGSGGYKNYDIVNTDGSATKNGNFGNTYEDVTIGEIKYTIRNVEATIASSSSGAAVTGIKSFGIKDGALYSNIAYDNTDASGINGPISDGKATTDKVILNGIENTLKVVGDNSGNSLSNAIINAYGTAVEFDSTNGGSLTLTNTTVNGGIKADTFAILGSNDSSKTDTLVLKNTVVNGSIDMKDGTNAITAGNNTTINGDVEGGDGKDTFTSGDNVTINGKIDLGDGNNEIILGNKVYINGDIDMGTNGVNLTGGSEVYFNGKVTFTANKDVLTLGEKSIIVQDIDMQDGNDELTIGAGSIVNATLNGGDGTDTLTFRTNLVTSPASITEDNMEDSINISHNISNFENINVGTKVTFASDLSITGTNNIVLEKDGELLLTLDKNDLDSGKIKGHALFDSGITVSSTGGKMLLDLDGANGTEIITFGNINLEDSIVPGDNETLDITSKVHTIKAGANSNEVVLVLRWSIPEILKYKGLNEIYHGISSVNDLIGNFNIKSDEQLVTFIEYLNNIYAGSPYSYSSELSRKSAGMFRDIVTDNQFKANTGKWMIYGGLTHVDGGTKDIYYGKGYYTYDIGSSDMDADTKITGAYMLGEYGVSDTLTSGVIIGGNKLKSDMSNGSKVDGSTLYLGAYAKKYVGNLKVTAGAGFQYGYYDADRMAINKVASSQASPVMKYSDNYNDITYDIYLNGRYSHNIGENLFLEPYATLSYTYIDQDGANEGSEALAIETDSKSFNYTVGKVGADLKKVIPHEKGKSTLSAGMSYTKILDGADEEYITGRFKGGSDFDILVAHKNEHSLGLNAKYALELENGILFDVKGNYAVERDSYNQSGKNKTKGEWIVGAGIGYKF